MIKKRKNFSPQRKITCLKMSQSSKDGVPAYFLDCLVKYRVLILINFYHHKGTLIPSRLNLFSLTISRRQIFILSGDMK